MNQERTALPAPLCSGIRQNSVAGRAEVGILTNPATTLGRTCGNGLAILCLAALMSVVIVRPVSAESGVSFTNDVIPILTKYGCNSGGCHGKATGQNGFQLSLLGFEPDLDYVALVKEARGRRVFPGDSRQSLVLLKATGKMPHGGGRPLEAGSQDFAVLANWIEHGAPGPRAADPVLERLTVEPERSVLAPGAQQQLVVTARFSDGSTRDVTRQAVYQSNESEIADADKLGLVVAARSGLFAVMVRFGDQIGAFYGTVPFQRPNAVASPSKVSPTAPAKRPEERTPFDKYLAAQWAQLQVEPSLPADDATFIRRVTLDLCGTLPSLAEVDEYVADVRADKRAQLIDRLLERPEYASYFALKWADILRNRGSGYGTSQQRAGTALFAAWIRDAIAENRPYDRFVSEILTASGSQEQNPPTVWYRSVRNTTDYVESIAQAFLGVRIQCAQCHHHPAERWSQGDYYSLAAVFAGIGRKGGFADAEVPTAETVFMKGAGETRHPRTGELLAPRPLGGPAFVLGIYDDPRRNLAQWMTAPDNPFFARTFVNRMWGHFFGRGIINPIDDARSTNPPSNPALLDGLAAHFVAQHYDVKDLLLQICNSYAYGLSSIPNETNAEDTQTFARFYPRRLQAEVLLDAFSDVLEVPTPFAGGPGTFPLGTRAIELPDENVPAHFLDVFGRPGRRTACECERADAPALAQALELVNSTEIQRKLSSKEGYVARLGTSSTEPAENVREIFVRVLGRPPRPDELATAVDYLATEADRAEGYRSLLWSVLATNEFLFNH